MQRVRAGVRLRYVHDDLREINYELDQLYDILRGRAGYPPNFPGGKPPRGPKPGERRKLKIRISKLRALKKVLQQRHAVLKAVVQVLPDGDTRQRSHACKKSEWDAVRRVTDVVGQNRLKIHVPQKALSDF